MSMRPEKAKTLVLSIQDWQRSRKTLVTVTKNPGQLFLERIAQCSDARLLLEAAWLNRDLSRKMG